ncbi:WD40 repeat protein (macronuclear) [Tetrahymena thermophila SB210]|uniref:WD40 repeat protein n=1 Tax=Tetrahymena thermophila (strain SB210) TaxID=312017 RepID=I7M9N5_TETTS|nr:WD40 repeat protein [Tetrahymena thermophila SB210]EAS02174.2 WD40 repeat protein [Tetrahymena thermophila SB210]|eukprot:XP_001022419.2 WD40 repeat protein [Tetrahymena thermophila SB210]
MSLVNPFEILDNIGSPRVFDIHSQQNIVAYESGNGILLWDLEVDKKVKLHNHESQVQAVFFGGSLDDKYIISLDGQFKVSIFISEWDSLRRVHQIYVPQKNRKKPVKSVIANYDKKNSLILVLENEDNGGYRLSVWEFKNEKLSLQFISDIDNNSCGLFIDSFNIVDQTHSSSTQIAIAEKNCVKYFKILEQNQVILTNRVHLKENVINMHINQTYNIVVALLHSGKVILIDQMGELVSQIRHDQYIFNSISTSENLVFCGASNGNICVYDISTCKIVQEILYDFSIRKSATINVKPQNDILISSNSQRKSFGSSFDYKVRNNEIKKKNFGPPICSLKNSSDGNLLVVIYSDGTTIVMDSKSQSIIHKQVGHTGRINQIAWDRMNKKRFYAVADDGFLSLWDFNGDRWLPKMVDLSQAFDNSINSFSKTNQQIFSEYHLREKSDEGETNNSKQKAIQIKSICLNSLKEEIYCGDNKGNLYILDQTSGKYINKYNLSGFKICQMSISPGFKYLGVYLVTGLTLLFDCTNRFQLQIKLEDSQEKQAYSINPGIILLEDSTNAKQSFKDSFSLNTINNVDKSFLSILHGTNNKSKQYYHSSKSDNKFLAITVHSQNSLRLHSISQTDINQMNSIVIANFSVEGLIQSFAIHPSNQYVLILSNIGYVYVFNIKSSELRGKIDVPRHSQRISIDPSGLYFSITAFSSLGEDKEQYLNANIFNSSYNSVMRTDKSTLTIYNPQKEVDLFFKKKPDVKPNRVVLYEIGTGNLVGEIPSLFNIECIQFSDEGKFLCIGSNTGILSLWSTCQEVRENIFEVLDQMKVKEDFWRDFPIYLAPKENLLEDNIYANNDNNNNNDQTNNEDYREKEKKPQDDISVNLSTRSIQIGTNYFQKQGVPKTGRNSIKDKETSRIIEPKGFYNNQQFSPEQEKQQQLKVKSMQFYDTQNKLPLSSVGGTFNNLQFKNYDQNQNDQGNYDRFYRSKNDLFAIQKQLQNPPKTDIPPQESIKAQQERSNLTQEKLRELNFRNREFDRQNEKQIEQQKNAPKDNYIYPIGQTFTPISQKQQQEQFQNHVQQQSQERGAIGNQYQQFRQNPRERQQEPSDIDDDVIVKQLTQQNNEQSPDEVAWREQQCQNKKVFSNNQMRKPINNNIRVSQEYDDIPSPSSMKQSERSDSQFDQIERFEAKLKNNKAQQSQYSRQYQYQQQ